jgi:ribosome-associated protein
MPEALRVSGRVVIPEAALSVKAVRSSGPGGQNVNKVASKVELRIDLDRIQGLEPGARARLVSLTAQRRDASGQWLVVSQRTRDQHRNLEDAREKVRALVARCLVAPRRRRPSAPTASSREARLLSKKRAAARKRLRARPAAGED